MASVMCASSRLTSLKGVRASAGQRVARVCRLAATPQESEVTPTGTTEGTIFYAGKAYTPAEWNAAKDSGALLTPAAAPTTSSTTSGVASLSFNDVMSFGGTGPEIINGRLAMLGFVAAVGAELSSGEGVLKQVTDEPTLITLAFVLFISGSLVTAFKAKRDEKLGPFTRQAELINGRAAMIGFAALLAIELVKGSPLF